jgi:hypothetical protein
MAVLAAFALAVVPARAAQPGGVRISNVSRERPALPLTLRAGRGFQLVGLRWRGSGRLELRAGRDGRWTHWVTASQEAPTWVGASGSVQLRRAGAGRVRRLRVSFIDSPAGHVSDALLPSSAHRPQIVSRAGWGADESLRRGPPEIAPALKMVFVHHTDTARLYPCSDSARIVRAIYAYHVLTNGWNDIGYNFLVDRCGTVFEGRYGGITLPVVGAHARGFNVGSAGIAVIGTFTSHRPARAARRSLRRLIAWRLDVAHVDPTSMVTMVSTGNERFRRGARVRLRAVSGHRDTGATTCPGEALYRLLPRIAAKARSTGLPKIFAPSASRDVHRRSPGQVKPIRFRATLSHAAGWTLTVRGPDGVLAQKQGHGDEVDWTWQGEAPLLAAGEYRWSLKSADARAVRMSLGSLDPWGVKGAAVAVSGDIASGDASSLERVDGNVLTTTGAPSQFTTVNRLKLTRAQFAGAGTVGASLRMPVTGIEVEAALWDYATATWVDVGGCTTQDDSRCTMLAPADAGRFGRWLPRRRRIEMRVRYSAPAPMTVEASRALARE